MDTHLFAANAEFPLGWLEHDLLSGDFFVQQKAAFEAEYGARLAEAYPQKPYGTVLPFRRIFAVAHKEA